ncbi:MAG: deoxyribose-phosphate aldolase [Flaviaesturariibacter sp.]|nr:deoxyribose-phosphate aldolase [Flaviaesturariibacter sp.]
MIDHTVLAPTTTAAALRAVCDEAVEWGFAAVCVPPYHVRDAGSILAGQAPAVATVIGFPFGYSHFTAKAAEAAQAIADGADEIDMVINLAALRANDKAWLESEIDAVVKVTEGKAILKLIIESGILSHAEIVACCALYQHYPVDFLKTSTGYAASGASVEAVALMRQHLPDRIRIKASGGIRDHVFAQQLVDAGAARLGCSASVAIVKGEAASGPGGY